MIVQHKGQWYKVLTAVAITDEEAEHRRAYHARTGQELPPATEIVTGPRGGAPILGTDTN